MFVFCSVSSLDGAISISVTWVWTGGERVSEGLPIEGYGPDMFQML